MDKGEINLIKSLFAQESNFTVDQIQDDTKITSMDIDSLALFAICSEIEDKYKISLITTAKDIQELNIKQKTFKEFIEFIELKIDNEKK